jgi:hypothetical protein
MKALSFRQPWAELVLQGRKTMDLRTYNTHYRGRILIHAAQTVETGDARRFDLDPTGLAAGGFVGTVEVRDVIALDEATYEQTQDQHLNGRSFRSGMYGWVLADPQRFAACIPAPGRTNLFEATVKPEEIESEILPVAGGAAPAPPAGRRGAISAVRQPASPRPAEYRTAADEVTPERPFALQVKPIEESSTDYALVLRQRVVERPHAEPHIVSVVTISGDNLRAVADHVLEALRRADYKVTDLSPSRRKPFLFPEEIGVRLGLIFLTVKPLTKLLRVEAISSAIRQMPSEEAYYWYSKCTATATAERAQRALRMLLAGE